MQEALDGLVVRVVVCGMRGSTNRVGLRYVTAKEQRVVIVRAFIKKTEKTTAGEIVLALQRAKGVKP